MSDSPHDDPEFVRIFQYSEWLDAQHLMRPESEVGAQSHEQLVLDYLAESNVQSDGRISFGWPPPPGTGIDWDPRGFDIPPPNQRGQMIPTEAPTIDSLIELGRDTSNAQAWAQAFVMTCQANPELLSSHADELEGLMIGWFANAIESAKDRCREACQ